MAQNRRTSDGVYDALKQISVEEKIDFGLDKYTPETFRKKYFTGPGNIENLYNILEGISKDEKIDFGQGTRDEWLESFGYRRSAEDGRYETLEGKRAGGAADVEEMNRRKQARQQPQPTSSVPQVNPTDTQPQQPAPSQPTTPKSADNNKISRAPGIRQTGDPGATQLGVPFKPDTRMTAAERDKVYRENDFAVRQVRAMQNEEKHRQQPLVDTGSKEANKHIIKTEGEWEDDLQKGASRISRSVVTPAIGKAIAEFDKKAHEVFEEGRRGSNDGTIPTGVAGGAGVFGNVRESNLTKDPDKILKYLQQQMEGVYNDPSFAEEIGKEADKAGIDRTEYLEKVIKPQIESDLGRQFENAMVDRYLPKSGLEYVVGGLSNSIVGMIADTFLNTKSQQYYKNQAEAMTEEGKNPYYNPGTGASLARVGVTFAADAPFFGVSGRVGGMAAKNLAERQIKTMMAKGLSENAARSIVGTALENSVGARMKNYIMQHVVSSGITMGGFNAMSEAARQTRDKEGYDLGKIAESTAEGLATGAAFGLTGGAVQALSQPLTGIAKVGSKVAGFGAEAETMYATEELSKMAHGEEGFENPFEGSVEALMKLGVMKASSPGGLVKAAEGIIHPIKSNQRQRTGMQFSKEEEDYVRNTADGKSLLDALSNMHPEIAISEVNGKKQLTPEGEQMRRQLADNYNDFMANKEIPATVKQKVAGVFGGVYRPGLETGADIIHNNDGSVILKTRDKDGNCIRDIKFDSFSDAEQWRDTSEDEFKLNDAVNGWNGTDKAHRIAAVNEIAETFDIPFNDARDMVYKAMDRKDTSLDKDQYDFIFGAITRNAYPADEYNPQRRYQEGKQLTPEERHFAQADAQVAEERLAQYGDDFAKEVIDAAEYPDEKMAELATRSDITKEQVEAARDYYNSAAKVRGMMDEAIKGIDEQVEAANAAIRRNTHPDSGALITGTHDGNNFYVTAGHFQITPDGRIEPTDNSGAVIVRDINTGEIEVMSPKDITITAINDPVRMMEANDSMEGLRGELTRQADESIEFAPGTPETPQEMGEVFTGADGKMYMVTGEPDETGNWTWMKLEIGEDRNPVGSPQPLDIEEYRKAKSDEIDAANRPAEEQALDQEGQINDTNNGQNYAQNQPENMYNEAQPSETQQETKGQINGQNGGQNGGQNEGQPQNASRIPVDDKGRQQFEQAKPEDTLAELTEKHGAEKTERMVSKIIENTARKLDELSKKDVSDITDMADLEAHEAEIAALQGKLDYWNGISEAIKSEKAKKTWENLVNPKEIRNFAKDPGGQQKWVDEHIDEIVDSYTRTHGNLLDPDELRNALTPIGYNGKNVPDFKRQTDRLVQAVYEKMLLKAVENGNASITLLTGAGGADKSTATRQMDLSGRGVVYDAAFNRFNKLDKAIEAAKAAGMKDIQVIAVYNDADTSFSNTLKRGKENGRFLSLDYFVNDAFMNNQDKIGQLRQAHPDVEIVAFDNSGNRASERPEGGRVSVDEAEKWDYTLNDAKLNELLDIFENGINEGRFAEDEIASVGQGLRGVTRRIPDLRVQTEQRVSGLVRRISGQDVPDLRPGVSGEPVQRGRGGLVPPADGGVQGSPEERSVEGDTGAPGQTPATEARTDEEAGNGRPDRPAAGSDGGDGPEPPAAGAAGGSGAAVPGIDSGRTGGIDESIPSDTEGAVRGGGHTSDSAGMAGVAQRSGVAAGMADGQRPAGSGQPAIGAKQKKIYQNTVEANRGRTFTVTLGNGNRSVITVKHVSHNGDVVIIRQDYDPQGNAIGEPREERHRFEKVGRAILENVWKKELSTEEKLRKVYKYKVGDVPVIDVLTDEEQRQLLEAYNRGDKELVGNLTGDLIQKHREDIILRGRDLRGERVEKAFARNGRGERLRGVRDQYRGFEEALTMLSDEAMQPTTIEEYVADAFGDVPKMGDGFLAYTSYDKGGNTIVGLKDETGFGSRGFDGDTKGFNPWLAPKGKGMSLKQFAESIHETLPEGLKEQYSDQDIRNVIGNIMTGAEKPTDIANYILRNRVKQAEAEARHTEEQWMEAPDYQKVVDGNSFASRLQRAKDEVNTEPTEGQKKAGNYKKGHLSFGGYDFTIENPAGSIRRGVDEQKRPWEQKMNNTYGYILGKKGKDGDHLDMFINDNADLDNWNGNVYVVDQVKPDGSFDEHKILVGFDSEAEAREAYLSNYEEGWQGLGRITGVDKETFDKWLDSSNYKIKDFADYSIVKNHMVERRGAAFDAALRKLDEREISIDDPNLLKEYGLRNVTLSRMGDHLTLTHFIVDNQGQGNGTRFMEDLARLADEKGWTLALTPDTSFGGTSVKRLKDFYKRFGFKENKGRNADFYTRESMIRRPEDWQPMTPEQQEQAMRDAVVEHLKKTGIEVSDDWKEGQRILDQYNGSGKVKKMGSRVDSKKSELSDEFNGKELSEGQQAVADVYTGKKDNAEITVNRDGQDYTVTMRQGNENKAGTKHSLYRHYGTGVGVITADDIIRIPDILTNGERTVKQRGNVKLAQYRLTDETGKRYTVITELKNSGEVFNDFYTNKKAPNQTPQMPNGDTPEGARTNDLNASGAKVQQNPETSKENSEKLSQHKFFKTPDGHAYGFTYKGKIYVDPRIATTETPIHEYGHLWAEMKRQTNPEEWDHIKQVMLGDELVQPIIERVKRDYPELQKEGKEDDFVEEVITQFSGKRGAERLREISEEIAKERGGIFGKAEAVAAMQRMKNILNRFWEGVAKMMGWKFRNANQIADRILADMLNGVNPREQMKEAPKNLKSQQEIERTLMGVHNISEEKLRKALKQGGLANPSMAVIDTNNHMHTDYGEISLIPKSSLIDSRTGRNAGTFTADAWTPSYPQVQKRMTSKGQTKFWKDIRKLNEEAGEMANQTRMAFDTWLDKEAGQERLAYWYLKEKGMNPELVLNENPYGKDVIDRLNELTDNGDKDVSSLPDDQIKEIADMYHAYKERIGNPVTPAEERIEKLKARIDPNKQTPFTKLQQFRLEELQKYGELLHSLNEFVYSAARASFNEGKPNVDATMRKARETMQQQNLQDDFNRWLDQKAEEYGVEEWLYNGTDNQGRQKWVRNTLDNASRLMKKEGLNGAIGWSSLGSWIATVANKEKTLQGIRRNKKNLNTTREEHDTWKEQWGERLYPLVEKLGNGDVFHGDNILKDILEHNDFAGYYKREYGKELTKEEKDLIDTFIKEVRTNFPTGYFETKFERPVGLEEFEVAVVPETTSPDIVEALKNAGLDVRTYDDSDYEKKNENRRKAAMEAVQGRDDIMFQLMGKEGAAEADKADMTTERTDNLRIAEESEKAGVDAKAIKLATGWERGADGKWRYEIPDADVDVLAKVNDKVAEMKADGVESPEPILKLSELLGEDNELFKFYPKMKDMQVLFSRGLNDGTAGSYDNGTITMNIKELNRFEGDDLNNENVYGTLLHEVQHAIQDIEGFARGGNLMTSTTDEGIKAIVSKKRAEEDRIYKQIEANYNILDNPEELKAAAELDGRTVEEERQNLRDMIDDLSRQAAQVELEIEKTEKTRAPYRSDAIDLYNRLAGEVEARNVTNRMALNDIGKRQTLASVTEDVPREDQVIINGEGGESASMEETPKFQRAGSPEPEMTPEERQYWKKWDDDMRKWKERNAIPAEAAGPGEKPQFRQGENALDFAQRLIAHNREKALWQTAPRLEDYRQKREDKDILEAARKEEKRYPDSPLAKMRRVAAELQQIRRAMSQQKAYDKATVKAVTDFAQDFMRQGFGDHLSRGEMERILSSVKNATGAKQIKEHVDNIMNILMDNQLRNLDQQVQKLSSVKELRQTAQGVEKQGKLELKGQRMIKAFREAREGRMDAEKIRERMNDVAEKMARNDEEAPMWEQEYEGLSIALQYQENIEASRDEYKELERLYKDAVDGYKGSGRSYKAQQELLESIDEAMMENKVERIGLFGDIIGRLEGNISESMQGAKEFVERDRERVKKIQQMANFDLAGKDMGAMREKSGKPANFFLQPLGTFEQMLKMFGGRNVKGEGYLYDYFMRNWMDSTDKAYLGEKKAKGELDAKAREVFGDKVRRWSDLYDITRNEKEFPGMDLDILDQENPRTFHLSQGNLLYIYMADKMADGRMKLRKMGIDEEKVRQVKDFLDPRLVQLGDWLQDEYLPGKRTEYNKVHERMFGAPMAAIDHYFPIKILGDARVKEEDVNVPDSEMLPSTITGNIIKRRRNALPLDILHTDALSLAIEHVEDMERWAATAEWNRDINTLLSYTTFRNKVKNMKTIYGSGDALWNAFKDAARMAAGTYESAAKPGSIDKAVTNIAKGVTAAKINFRPYTALKQLLSAPAFLTQDASYDNLARYFLNPKNYWRDNFKWAIENMPVFRKRWESRQIGDTRLMDSDTDWNIWRKEWMQKATRAGMWMNAAVDALTIAAGARSIYETNYKKYREIGASEAVARKRALQDAEIGYNLTQQSSEGAFVSRIQKDRTVAANMLSVFRNSSMSYTRQWVDAARNLNHMSQKGYKEDSIGFMKRQMQEQFGLDEAQAQKAAEAAYNQAGRREVAKLLNMMFGVTVAWNLGASLPYLLLGDDDKTKKEMMTDALLKGLVAGPTEGMAAGNIVSDLVSLASNESVRKSLKQEGAWKGLGTALDNMGEYEMNPLPLFADMERMISKLGYDGYAAAQDLFNICVQSAVGVNPQTFTDMWNACMDYGNPEWMPFTDGSVGNKDLSNANEIALFIMRVMNAPASSWKNKYIDELGMDAEDARKLPYDEMAKRYANYKHWKDAPLMGWLRGEEKRKAKIEKLQQQFDKAVVERMERLTDDELADNIMRSHSAEEKRKYAKIESQRLGLTNKSTYEKPDKDSWYQEDYHERMLYDDIREDGMLAQAIDDMYKSYNEGLEEAAYKSAIDELEYTKANKDKKKRLDEAKGEIKKRLDWIRDGKYDSVNGRPGKSKDPSKQHKLLYGGKKQFDPDDEKANEAIMKNIRKWRKEALEIALRAESNSQK